MRLKIGQAVIELVQGDITTQNTKAIVNAANSGLRGGGGVDGAIHRAGGPSIMRECREIGGCPTGEARITGAGNLLAKHVIHAVGPIYRGGGKGEEKQLAGAYRYSLTLAGEHGLSSVSFPSISTGVYGYPIHEAARVAMKTVKTFLESDTGIRIVRFVLFGQSDYDVYKKALQEIVE